MARLARGCQVRPRQRKLGCAVVERRRLPRGCGVARLAALAEIPRDVIGARRPCKIGTMTLVTI